jgi:hypothetical protein
MTHDEKLLQVLLDLLFEFRKLNATLATREVGGGVYEEAGLGERESRRRNYEG